MNCRAHYDRLMQRAVGRALAGYSERHHVVPRCMGGGDEHSNLVRLTPEEHFVAHQLLVKMHPGVVSLVHAAVLMAKNATGNKAFGWLRRRKAAAMRGHAINLGRKASEETRAKMSLAQRGNKRALGNKLSAETRARMSAAKRGSKRPPATDEARANMAAAQRGKTLSAEARAKLSAAHRGSKRPPRTAQWRERQANAQAGKQVWLGRKHSPETIAKLAAIARARSPEQIAKLSAARWPQRVG